MLNPFRFIEFNAKAYPVKFAQDDGSTVLTHRQFHLQARRVAARLRKAGVRSGDLVVTCLPAGLDWLFTNALFHEACITCSNHGYSALDPALGVDWIITSKTEAHFPADRTILIDQAWLEALEQEAAADRVQDYADENALCRLVLTSGTTGHAKAIAFTVGMLDGRIRSSRSYWSVSRADLTLMGLSTIGGIVAALSASFSGGTYFAPPAAGYLQIIRKYGLRSLIGAPGQLARLAEAILASGQSCPTIREIRSAGGALSPALIAMLRKCFQAEIYNVYGATEVGGVALSMVNQHYESAMAGYLLDGAVVEVVDETGAPLPANAEGDIRIRNNHMAGGYYRNPEASEGVFRGGWFYPGDRGMLAEDGLLRLAGRGSELINRGGVKIDPVALDQFLTAYPGVADAAAFGLEDAAGVQELVAALVVSPGLDMEKLRAELLQKFGKAREPKFYFRVQGIPRNEMGKVMRAQMSQHFTGLMRERGAAGLDTL